MRILMIIAACDRTGSLPTIGQVVEPYYQFRDCGAEVVLASPEGGAPVATSASLNVSGPSLRFRSDHHAREAFADTLCLEQVFAEDFDAAYYIGPAQKIQPGSDDLVSKIVQRLLALGKPVALVSAHFGKGLMIQGASPRSAALALVGTLATGFEPALKS